MIRAFVLVLALAAAPATAQTGVQFSGLKQDTSLPVEVTADSLRLDQSDGSAIFSGNVVVIQGEMRLAAPEVRVEYTPGDAAERKIERMIASGGVTFTTGPEAAESDTAVYTVGSGLVEMTGNVLLTQGANTLASERMVVNLTDGTGTLDGRVRTVIDTGATDGGN